MFNLLGTLNVYEMLRLSIWQLLRYFRVVKRGNMGKFCPRGTTVDVVVVPGVGQNYCTLAAITFHIHFPPPCTLSAQNRHVEDRRKEAYKEKSVTLLRL